jgi:phage shock protein A
MGVFSRLSEIVASNLNALLDRAEDPELLLRQLIREMEDGLRVAKRYAATAIAVERRLGRELDWNREQMEVWKTRARQALAAGREDLGRNALAHKQDHDAVVCDLAQQHATAEDTSYTVRSALAALERRLAEARRKQRSLVARNRAARVRVEVSEQTDISFFVGGPWSKLSRLEDRLEQSQEELVAYAELNEAVLSADRQFSDMDRQRAIDAEWEALKREAKAD